ncbi:MULTISPECIES: DUF998 domain-containing protein [Gordonia]|uniref:DUF998 domain-containing protein n=1 Tax=Gordonia sihwensis NBRC 108236 TaxID=1223544 RepID=L7LMM4_9ACTN|nr:MULTISPECIES: DUF998 domain-containing protein [Gordonia]AUH69685.1 hypothetical protein CXX93_16865 [Gordonia sp. YC-JH1]KJR09348.1 hypothetical protein UG54_04760 [Gordonia sihwensis]KXT57504.1 hypothetical protein Y710_08715 [Gordonia sp. QH-12]GAC62129.1 hypothetical protein GSI01S_29_00170 [Gordonia sihwensis NBRC 108236]
MSSVLAVISVILWLARLGMFAGLHMVASPYNAIEHAVSDYAVGPTKRLSAAMTWTTALGWLTLAGAVWWGLTDWPDRGLTVFLLLILTAIFTVLPLVPTDVEGQTITRIGIVHYVLAIAWFAIAYSLTGNFSRWMTDAVGGSLAVAGQVLHIVTLVALIAAIAALVITPLRRRLFGTAERVFLVAVTLFYLLVAIALLGA